jgi:ElaB/YqjD/DUF883 family membrane-anchored ribosome-binding protein
MQKFDNLTQTSDAQERQGKTLTTGEPAGLDKIKTTISSKLHDAAQTLREKAGAFSGKNQNLANYGNQTADWLHRSANYLEEMNPQQLKSDIQKQVSHNPGRSLLIAAGVGLLVGTLFRRR